jgi:hypothetical protein
LVFFGLFVFNVVILGHDLKELPYFFIATVLEIEVDAFGLAEDHVCRVELAAVQRKLFVSNTEFQSVKERLLDISIHDFNRDRRFFFLFFFLFCFFRLFRRLRIFSSRVFLLFVILFFFVCVFFEILFLALLLDHLQRFFLVLFGFLLLFVLRLLRLRFFSQFLCKDRIFVLGLFVFFLFLFFYLWRFFLLFTLRRLLRLLLLLFFRILLFSLFWLFFHLHCALFRNILRTRVPERLLV